MWKVVVVFWMPMTVVADFPSDPVVAAVLPHATITANMTSINTVRMVFTGAPFFGLDARRTGECRQATLTWSSLSP